MGIGYRVLGIGYWVLGIIIIIIGRGLVIVVGSSLGSLTGFGVERDGIPDERIFLELDKWNARRGEYSLSWTNGLELRLVWGSQWVTFGFT